MSPTGRPGTTPTRRRRSGEALRAGGDELGLPEPDLVVSLLDRWPDVVGATVAEHARPRSLRDGVLTVAVDAPPWATQLRYLEGDIRRAFGRSAAATASTRSGSSSIRRVERRAWARPSTGLW